MNEQENTSADNSKTEQESSNNTDIKTENTNNTDVNDAEKESVNTDEKIRELNDKYLRLYSEFDNFRKRTIKERSDLIKTAGEDIFKSLLPVIDDFERAIKANENIEDVSAIKEGIHLIYNKLKHNVNSKGLMAFESIGQSFDADLMEAITHIPAASEDQKGKVIDEVEKGYKLGDKVIRFAKVVIAQ